MDGRICPHRSLLGLFGRLRQGCGEALTLGLRHGGLAVEIDEFVQAAGEPATALKLETIRAAREAGVRLIQTDNEENNPMFDLNLKLGFQPQPGYLFFERAWEGAMDWLDPTR